MKSLSQNLKIIRDLKRKSNYKSNTSFNDTNFYTGRHNSSISTPFVFSYVIVIFDTVYVS